MLASAKAKSRICDVYDKHLRHNTNAYKRRVDAITQKPVIALQLLRSAIDADIKAEYVLMDTWFTTEPFICSIKDLGLEVIGMLKDTKQQYWYKGRLYNLKGLEDCHPSLPAGEPVRVHCCQNEVSAASCQAGLCPQSQQEGRVHHPSNHWR